VELLLTADEPSSLPVKNLQGPIFLSEVDGLARVIAALMDIVPESELRTLHLFAPDLCAVGDLAAQAKNMAAALVPEGFNLSLGARRSLRNLGEDQSWSAKDFFRQQPFKVKVSTAFSERFLKTHNLMFPKLDDDRLRQLVVAAVEKITGFKK
jgi:hypothetical protein